MEGAHMHISKGHAYVATSQSSNMEIWMKTLKELAKAIKNNSFMEWEIWEEKWCAFTLVIKNLKITYQNDTKDQNLMY